MEKSEKQIKVEVKFPPRGIIVVDTSTLLRMCVPLPRKCLTPEAWAKGNSVCLADGLKWLSSHGYEVIIPEMVANECGGFMRDGTSICDYSPEVKNSWHSLTKDFFHSIPNTAIQIMPAPLSDTSLGARYLNENYSIHKNPHYDGKKKLQHFASANIRYGKEMHRGDKAAYELIKALGISTMPVFYLNKDAGAWADVARLSKQLPVRTLNHWGLYSALRGNKILAEIGIKNIPIEELNNIIVEQVSKITKNQSIGSVNPVDKMPKSGGGLSVTHPFSTGLSHWLSVLKEREILSGEALRAESPTLAHEDYVRSYRQYVVNRDTATVKGR